MYEIELEPPEIGPACDCCDERPVRLTRFLIKDDAAYGAYFAVYSNQHADRGVHVLLSLGPWWEESRQEERSCFYLQLWPAEEHSSLRLGDVEKSPWGPVDIMGAPFSREEALLHPLKQEIFEIHGVIGERDTSIRSFFDRWRSGDASIPLERRYMLPDAVFELSPEEQEARAKISEDLVVLDDARFFVRSLIAMPIEDHENWVVATWCEIPQADFETLYEVWEVPDRYARFACRGTVANVCSDVDPSGYLGAAVDVGGGDHEQLPVIVASDHPPLMTRITEPWAWDEFLTFAVSRGFL